MPQSGRGHSRARHGPRVWDLESYETESETAAHVPVTHETTREVRSIYIVRYHGISFYGRVRCRGVTATRAGHIIIERAYESTPRSASRRCKTKPLQPCAQRVPPPRRGAAPSPRAVLAWGTPLTCRRTPAARRSVLVTGPALENPPENAVSALSRVSPCRPSALPGSARTAHTVGGVGGTLAWHHTIVASQ